MIYFTLTNERLKAVSFQDDLAVFNLIRYFKTIPFSTTSTSKQLAGLSSSLELISDISFNVKVRVGVSSMPFLELRATIDI